MSEVWRKSAIGVVVALLPLTVLGAPRERRAQPPEDARAATARATAAYRLGHYRDSALAYEDAFKLAPDEPGLLYNVAQAWRLAGEPDKAIIVYKSFLLVAPPDSPNRPQAEARLAELDAARRARASAQTPVPTPVPAAPTVLAVAPVTSTAPPMALPGSPPAPASTPPPWYRRAAVWVVVGAVVVAAGAAAIVMSRGGTPAPCGGGNLPCVGIR